MPDYYIAPESSFDATADAIRAKTGSQSSIEWTEDGFADAIAEIPSGYSLDDICDASANGARFSGAIVFNGTYIWPYLFAGSAITSFTGANVTSMTTAAGSPFATKTGANNFSPYTFAKCTQLVTVSLPKLADLFYCDNAFNGCSNLETIVLDNMNLTRLGTGVFCDCQKLYNGGGFVFPKVESPLYGSFIKNCKLIEYFDVGSSSFQPTSNHKLRNQFANGASSFNKLILRFGAVMQLENIEAFGGTPFASNGTGGTLYVPNSLKSQYESATNWSTILGYTNNSIVAIEGSYYETHYADGTAIPTT